MDTQQTPRVRTHRHSGPALFFPILLITIGVLWMMVNSGQASYENIQRLGAYWPVLLIAGGLGLMLRRVSWFLESLVWLAVAGAVIWYASAAPKVALPASVTSQTEPKHSEVSTPLSDMKSASVELHLSAYPSKIGALSGSSDLFSGDIYYDGDLKYDASTRGTQGRVSLSEENNGFFLSAPMRIGYTEQRFWQIGLTPKIPLDVAIDGGAGSATVDLSGLQLARLEINGGAGSMEIRLPEDSPSYEIALKVGAGSVTLTAPPGAVFSLDAEGGLGTLDIVLPGSEGAQVEVKSAGLGGIDFSSSYTQVKKGGSKQEGVWQNSAYSGSKSPITITLQGGVGNTKIR